MANVVNFNDPMFIHPSDTPGMNLINDQLLGTDNYGIWSRAMLIALRAKNKTGFIDGTCARPTPGHAMLHQWERCNALVLSWIMNTVSKEIFGGIVYSTYASVVWGDLKEQFDKINGSRIFSLHHEIGRLTQGNNTISAYYCKMKQLWDEFSPLVVLPSCACPTARQCLEHDQQQRLLQFLMGLNESYFHVRSQILMMNPLSTVGQAFSIISQEESYRSVMSIEVPPVALFSSQGKSNNLRKDTLKCDNCNWSGHTKENCYKLVGYPPGHRLHKTPNRGQNQNKRANNFNRKPLGDVNMSDGIVRMDNSSSTVIEATTCAPTQIFTPEQYAEIMKLLGTSNIQPHAEPMVNMTGPQDWETNGDW